MIILKEKSDILGSVASSLCLIHCMATPFLFIAQSYSATQSESTPIWWKSIDYIFLVISFFAIYWSTKTTSKKWVKPMLWISWIVLALIIINEKLEYIHLAESTIYIPAVALILLHLYNRKYCQCNNEKCYTNNA